MASTSSATEPFPGFVVQSADYVARVILRALRTGEDASTSRTAPSSPS